MKYLEMLDILGGADSTDSLRRAIDIPPSDPAHELAWIQAAEVLNRHSRAIVDYVNERMAEGVRR